MSEQIGKDKLRENSQHQLNQSPSYLALFYTTNKWKERERKKSRTKPKKWTKLILNPTEIPLHPNSSQIILYGNKLRIVPYSTNKLFSLQKILP